MLGQDWPCLVSGHAPWRQPKAVQAWLLEQKGRFGFFPIWDPGIQFLTLPSYPRFWLKEPSSSSALKRGSFPLPGEVNATQSSKQQNKLLLFNKIIYLGKGHRARRPWFLQSVKQCFYPQYSLYSPEHPKFNSVLCLQSVQLLSPKVALLLSFHAVNPAKQNLICPLSCFSLSFSEASWVLVAIPSLLICQQSYSEPVDAVAPSFPAPHVDIGDM